MVMMKINKTNEIPIYFSYETISDNNWNRIPFYKHRNILTCEYFYGSTTIKKMEFSLTFCILNNSFIYENVKILIKVYIFFFSLRVC